MELINTRRLRVSLRRFNPAYGESFRWWIVGSYKSRDHGRPRAETNLHGAAAGILWHVKWRPDGRTGDCPNVGCTIKGPHIHNSGGPEQGNGGAGQ